MSIVDTMIDFKGKIRTKEAVQMAELLFCRYLRSKVSAVYQSAVGGLIGCGLLKKTRLAFRKCKASFFYTKLFQLINYQ